MKNHLDPVSANKSQMTENFERLKKDANSSKIAFTKVHHEPSNVDSRGANRCPSFINQADQH
jgi:hypothetical protein